MKREPVEIDGVRWEALTIVADHIRSLRAQVAVLSGALAIVEGQEQKLGQALEEIVCAHSLLKRETYYDYSLKTALRALGR